MKRHILTIILLFQFAIFFGQEIKVDLPTIIPPSPNVAALMKFEEVPVGNYTGIPDISIPLFSSATQSKDIDINLSLKYHPDSAAANERASDIGLGWSLFAGGTISRSVRGLPDEIYSMLSGHEKLGLYQSGTSLISNDYYQMFDIILNWFGEPPVNPIDANAPAELNEGLWNSHIKGFTDTEHDLWQFNFMGRSGRFYIEKNQSNQLEVKPLDDYRIKIINHYGDTQNPYIPTSFTIFDEKGFEYTFDEIEETNINTLVDSVSSTVYLNSTDLGTFYSYRSAFHLSKIEDNQGNVLITFNYNPTVMEERTWDTAMTNYYEDLHKNSIAGMDSIRDFLILNPCGGFVQGFNPYPLYTNVSTQKASFTKKIQNIAITGIANINFSYSLGRGDDNFQNAANCYKLDEISINNWSNQVVKKIKLTHGNLFTKINRMSLDKVEFTTPANLSVEKYELQYKNVLNPFSDPAFVNTDYWGYFNLRSYPEIGGHGREVDPKFCTTETLQKMVLPTRGCVIYDFEPNTYSYIGSAELTNFDGNPYNWNKHQANVYFEPNPVNQSVPFGSTLNLTHFFTISEEQDVIFKANIETISQNNQLQYFFYIYNEGCTTTACMQGSVNFEANDNEKIFKVHLLPGSYEASFSSPVTGSHTDLIKGDITAYYKIKNSNDLKFLYGGGNRISKIGYFTDGNTPQDYYEGSNPGSADKEKRYDYLLNTGLSGGSLVYNVPDFTYDKKKKECPNCIGAPTSTPGFLSTWKNDQDYMWWYNITTSFNNLNPIKTQGADVGYKKVRVFEANNGFSTFVYTSPIDFPEDIGPLNLNPPFMPTKNFDYKRGLLTDETHFDNQGRPLIYKNYVYAFENYIANTGFRSYNREFEFINIRSNQFFTEYSWYLSHCNQYAGALADNSVSFPLNEGSHCFCYYGRPEEFIEFEIIKEAYGWAKLTNKTTKEYFYPGGGTTQKIAQTNETYTYNPMNKQIDTHTVSNSKGETMKTQYYYHTGDAPGHQNRISEIEKIENYRGSNLLSTNNIVYDNTFSGNTSYLPKTVQTSKGSQALEDKLVYNAYDSYGHPLEVQMKNGMKISYIWGYNHSQPIAKIENASNADVLSALSQTSIEDVDEVNMSSIDGLRGTLPEAMVTTFTYIPLVGISSITDPKGETKTFEYDSFGRLKDVIDSDGNILSENEYNYRN